MLELTSPIRGFWPWILAVLLGLAFFLVFAAGYGLVVYLRPPKIFSQLTPRDLGAEFEEVGLRTADGLRLAAWFVPANEQTDKAIVLLHGYPADKGDILPATIFLRESYNLLYVDFRYFGRSEGKYSTIGPREVRDLQAAAEFLAQRDVQKIGVWGFSMGGAVGLMGLSAAPDIAAVVADSSYASLALMAEEIYRPLPGLRQAVGKFMTSLAKLILDLDLNETSPMAAAAQTRKPVLIIHSRDDRVIPFSHALRLQEASSHNPRAEFWFRQDRLHGELGTPEYQARVSVFFERHL